MIREQIDNRIACNYIIEPHRKINLLSINFITPITEGNYTIKSILPFILCESCEKFPSNKKLAVHLYDLYGANLEAVVDIIGLYQITGINLSFMDNRFLCFDEDIMHRCIELITEIILSPNFTNGQFDCSNVILAKEFVKSLILSEYYDNRNILIRYVQKVYGYNILDSCYGNHKDIQSVTTELLTEVYKSLLGNSNIEILSIGKKTSGKLYPFLDKIVNGQKPGKIIYTPNYPYNENIGIQEETEYILLNVSKLVIGFYIVGQHDPFAVWLLSIIYGDAPFSRLFITLREKQGLCYDCSMEYDPFSNMIFFICSLESKNKKEVQLNVINVLEDIKNNGISANELDNAKRLAKNKLLSFYQSTDAIWEWSILQILYNQASEPKSRLECINKTDVFQIEKAATGLVVKGIYFLDNCQGRGEIE